MKIIHIIDSLALGGAQTIVKGIVESKDTNIEHHIFVLRATDITINIDSPNITIYPSSKKYSFAPIPKLKQYIQEHNIDIIHCHLFRSTVFGYLLKQLYFPNINLIVHEHGSIFRNTSIYPQLLKIFSPKVNAFIAISKATKDNLIHKSNIPQDKIHLIYNFVDLDRFNPKTTADSDKIRQEYNLSSEVFLVGFAGRLIQRKGWREFVAAALELSKINPNLHFVIAGDGSDKEELKSLINGNAQIHYLGYMDNMPEYYKMLDCFVIPSHWEPMGLTEIEAMAMGTPVISTDVSALNEIIINRENGLLFESKNSNDLAKKIQTIYKDELLRNKLISNGLKDVKNYNLTNYVYKLNLIYDKLIK